MLMARSLAPFTLGLAMASVVPAAAKDEPKLTAEELVTRHVASLGSPEALAGVSSRLAEGTASLRVAVGGTAAISGRLLFFSAGRQMRTVLAFAAADYRGETLSFDGQKIDVGFMMPGRRSDLGTFLSQYDVILREGLVGGALSTAWPVLDLQGRKAKLKYEGLKKVEGRQLHQASYRMDKGQGDIRIVMRFDPETFHHVGTRYNLTLVSAMGREITESSKEHETHYSLEESFDGFQAFAGVTLPTRWTLRFGAQLRNRSSLWIWETAVEKVRHNEVAAPAAPSMQE
jgi:hypothetical protein